MEKVHPAKHQLIGVGSLSTIIFNRVLTIIPTGFLAGFLNHQQVGDSET